MLCTGTPKKIVDRERGMISVVDPALQPSILNTIRASQIELSLFVILVPDASSMYPNLAAFLISLLLTALPNEALGTMFTLTRRIELFLFIRPKGAFIIGLHIHFCTSPQYESSRRKSCGICTYVGATCMNSGNCSKDRIRACTARKTRTAAALRHLFSSSCLRNRWV
jgi:hypothetical protein